MAKSSFRDRFEPVQAIDVVDRYTVRITLKEPYAPFLNHLANPTFCAILPREAEDKFKDFNHPDAVIGTGPFVMKSYEKGVRVVYERNPTFYMKGFPYLDGVVIDITPDAAARLAVLRAGKAELPHIWGWVSPEEARAVKQTNPEMSVPPYLVIAQGFIYLRTDQPPFNDVRVRRALSRRSTARPERRAPVRRGLRRSRPSVRAQGMEARRGENRAGEGEDRTGYDPAEAKRSCRGRLCEGFTMPIYHWPGYVVPWRSYYELAADNLGKIGINVELKPEEYGKYISTTAIGKYEKAAMGPSTPFTEVDDFLFGRFYPELATNQSHVADAELTKLLLAQRREMDPKKRKQIVDDIQRYLADKAYYIYVPSWPQYVAHPPYVKGFRHHDGYGAGMRLLYTWIDK
jgi:peptide/nickel transport system substrate-binding protein